MNDIEKLINELFENENHGSTTDKDTMVNKFPFKEIASLQLDIIKKLKFCSIQELKEILRFIQEGF